jgi:endonuclease-3
MPRESKTKLKARALEIMRRLEAAHPAATTELRWEDPLQLLVATILSAQCTDERVNIVTQGLFRRYRSVQDFAAAEPAELEDETRSTGFFRSKTASVIGSARMILEEFGGEVPRTMEEMLRLPGVQRKTANVVLGTAFGLATGIVVDTHMDRVSKRLGLVAPAVKRPEKIEEALMPLFPQDHWISFSHSMVLHGRYTCIARKPNCDECPVEDLCPKVGLGPDGKPKPGTAKSRGKAKDGS